MKTKRMTRAERIAHELVPYVKAWVIAKAHAETWRERMDAWSRQELEKFEYKVSAEMLDKGRPERITEPKDIWMMNDEDLSDYMVEWQVYVDSLKIKGLKQGECPALVAEEHQRQVENRMIIRASELMQEPAFNLDNINSRLEFRAQAIDLIVKLAMCTGLITKENMIK